MRFHKDVNPNPFLSENQPPTHKPIPMQAKHHQNPDDCENFADVRMVARRLGVSPRHVQRLVQRKIIPVIRLGRRCIRFDLSSVVAAVKKFEVHERGR